VPAVLTPEEVTVVLGKMSGTPQLMASLLYGGGLRLLECCQLRIKDIDMARCEIVVRAGKGGKDRQTMLPRRLVASLEQHLARVRSQHEADLRTGAG